MRPEEKLRLDFSGVKNQKKLSHSGYGAPKLIHRVQQVSFAEDITVRMSGSWTSPTEVVLRCV